MLLLRCAVLRQEFCSLGDLGKAIELARLCHYGSSRPPAYRSLAILRDIADGMAFIHSKNLIHGRCGQQAYK